MPKTNNMSSKHKWYDIKAAGQKSADIYIYSEIGYWGITARQFVHDLQGLGELDQITAHINSIGGNVGDGIAIYNTLKKHHAHVTIEIDGYCLSIATVVAMAGDMIQMAANTLFMIHNPWGGAIGDGMSSRRWIWRIICGCRKGARIFCHPVHRCPGNLCDFSSLHRLAAARTISADRRGIAGLAGRAQAERSSSLSSSREHITHQKPIGRKERKASTIPAPAAPLQVSTCPENMSAAAQKPHNI